MFFKIKLQKKKKTIGTIDFYGELSCKYRKWGKGMKNR